MDEERLLSPDADESDKSLEKSLRPRYLAQYIGQDKVKQELSIYIEAAKIAKRHSTMCCYMARQV